MIDSNGDDTTYAYDNANQLQPVTLASEGTPTATFPYDGDGLRR